MRRPLLVVASVLTLAVAVIALAGQPLPLTRPTNQPQVFEQTNKPDMQPTHATEGCGIPQISAVAPRFIVGKSEAPILEGYVVVTKQEFGGLLAVDYRCETHKSEDVFRVQWRLIGRFWEVKKISRPPFR